MEIYPAPVQSRSTNPRSTYPIIPKRSRTSSFARTHVASCNWTPASEPGSPLNRRVLILGLGYVGKFLAQDMETRGGWAVIGTCTNFEKKKKLEEMGFDVHLFNANEPDPAILEIFNVTSHLLVSIPPIVGTGDPMLQHEELLKSRLMKGNLKWLGYLSSTSVYGDCGGDWVDENYPVAPTDEKAKARLAAEKGWLKLGHDLGMSTQIFRLGGIYGPGRSAVDTLIKRDPMSETQRMRVSRSYTSRVHVADICQALRASIDKPSFGRIYNVVDDDPTPRAEVFSYAQDLIDQKWPGYLKPNPTFFDEVQVPSSNKSYRGKKRVSNELVKRELGVRLLYTNYKLGLKSIVEHMDNPFL